MLWNKRAFARGLVLVVASAGLSFGAPPEKIKALLIDGQNNHAWKMTSPVIKKILEDSGRFTVDVATSPPAKSPELAKFKPNFAAYEVVISNYNGEPWSAETKAALVKFVRGGGGFVAVHAANNAFPEWKEYNEMIGLGGWGGRDEKSGPYVRFKDGKIVKETKAGRGGSHGKQHDFLVEIRDSEHPITKGLPASWMHVKDELYDRLRGPAENLTVLATAFASTAEGGSGENEPMLMVTRFGEGRVFHTTLGHSVEALQCVGATVTLARGAEWAATGNVTQGVPKDFPTPTATSSRK